MASETISNENIVIYTRDPDGLGAHIRELLILLNYVIIKSRCNMASLQHVAHSQVTNLLNQAHDISLRVNQTMFVVNLETFMKVSCS